MMVYRYILFVTFIAICSCGNPNQLDEKQYIEWVEDEDNKLLITKKIKNMVYSLQYQPPAYVWLKSSDRANVPFDSIKTNWLYDYFEFQIKSVDEIDPVLMISSTPQEAIALKQELPFSFKYYFQKKVGKQMIPVDYFHYHKSLSMKNELRFTLGFIADSSDQFQVQFKDEFWGAGTLNFTFKKENINNIPQLIIN